VEVQALVGELPKLRYFKSPKSRIWVTEQHLPQALHVGWQAIQEINVPVLTVTEASGGVSNWRGALVTSLRSC
jgi:hypothetical protein